jgi:xanthine/CO dehydrogenase XdhC/CoxF family maturation factor
MIVSGNREATGNIAGGELEYRVIKNTREHAKTLQSDL